MSFCGILLFMKSQIAFQINVLKKELDVCPLAINLVLLKVGSVVFFLLYHTVTEY